MKRRDFLATSAQLGLAGTVLPVIGRAATAPCPVPTVSVSGGTSASTPCVAETPGSAPQWFLDMKDSTWATPVKNTLDSVKPSGDFGNHAAICTAWTGGCADQSRGELILAANGGHGDYSGNEVYACAMRASSPVWARLTNPSVDSGGAEGKQTAASYGDGKPRTVHGWNRCVFGNGRVWYAGMDGMYPSGNWSTAVYSFNRSSLTWTYHGLGISSINQSSFSWQGGPAAYDRVGNKVWSIAQYATGQGGISVDASTGARTEYDWYFPDNRGGDWMVVAHNTSPRVLIHSVHNTGQLYILNLENVGAGWTKKTPGGSPSGMADGTGAVYHAPSRAILSWKDCGSQIRKLAIPSDPINGAYTWSAINAASGNAVTPPAGPSQGTFGKFNIIEDMGNGRSALVLVTSTTGPVYVYKLPASV